MAAVGESARALVLAVEREHGQGALEVEGEVWRWIDTRADGPVVVLLPGSIGDAAMFCHPVLALGREFRLVAVTYPALADARALASGLERVCDHLALRDFVLAGSSFGAYWAQFFALHAPHRVRHLVLGNSFVDAGDLAGHAMFHQELVQAGTAEAVHAAWLARVRQAPASELRDLQLLMLEERQTPQNLHARFLGVVRAEAAPPLPLRAAQATVLDCVDDPLISADVRKRVRACYPGSETVNLAHGGHYPHVLNPHAYAELLVRLAGCQHGPAGLRLARFAP
jgi:maspardin